MGVHALIDVVPQLGPLNASIYVFAEVRLLPPAGISAISMFTAVQLAGVVNVYHTSYLVPVHEPVIAELVALNKVPDVLTQEVPGVSVVGVAQSSDCASNNLVNRMNANDRTVRAVACGMAFKGFWMNKNYYKRD
jgi:hypothetical protein